MLQVFEGVPQTEVARDTLLGSDNAINLLSEDTNGLVFKSKGEARRMIQGGGVSLNKQKVTDGNAKPEFQLLNDRYLLVQKGKKNYYLVRAV